MFTVVAAGVVTIAGVTVNPCYYGIMLCCIVLGVFTAIVVRVITILFQSCNTVIW